jgi:hypothetical protein
MSREDRPRPWGPVRLVERQARDRRRNRWRCPGCGSSRWGRVVPDGCGGHYVRCYNARAERLHPRLGVCGVIDSRSTARRADDVGPVWPPRHPSPRGRDWLVAALVAAVGALLAGAVGMALW